MFATVASGTFTVELKAASWCNSLNFQNKVSENDMVDAIYLFLSSSCSINAIANVVLL